MYNCGEELMFEIKGKTAVVTGGTSGDFSHK